MFLAHLEHQATRASTALETSSLWPSQVSGRSKGLRAFFNFQMAPCTALLISPRPLQERREKRFPNLGRHRSTIRGRSCFPRNSVQITLGHPPRLTTEYFRYLPQACSRSRSTSCPAIPLPA